MLFYQFVFNEAKHQSFFSAVILPPEVRSTKPAIPLGFDANPFYKLIEFRHMLYCLLVAVYKLSVHSCQDTVTNYVLAQKFFPLKMKQKNKMSWFLCMITT